VTSRLFRFDVDRVHFGNDGLGATTIGAAADTLFSALCIQALRVGGVGLLDALVLAADTSTLRLSDLHPYVGRTYLVPKPIARVESGAVDAAAASTAKKAAKRLAFVPVDALGDFLAGRADLGALAEMQASSGAFGLASRAAIFNGEADAAPYAVEFFAFAPNAGLWLLATGTDEEIDLVTDLLSGLTAIGGERTSGYGSFTLTSDAVPGGLRPTTAGARLLALTTALPADSELDVALEGATYRLVRRSGFVASQSYADTPLRKRDLHKLAAGSVFTRPFNGVVADVSNCGAHPVWSYAKPLFLPLPDTAVAGVAA